MGKGLLFCAVMTLKHTKGCDAVLTEAVKIAFEVGDDIAEKLGLYLVDAEFVKEGKDNFLRLYIDKPGGVGIDECEKFSNAFGEVYDKIDPISEEYCLEVSSPGVERVLKTKREYDYFKGREVAVKLYAAIDGKKEFEGILKDFDGERVIVSVDETDVSFTQKEAVFVRLAFRI